MSVSEATTYIEMTDGNKDRESALLEMFKHIDGLEEEGRVLLMNFMTFLMDIKTINNKIYWVLVIIALVAPFIFDNTYREELKLYEKSFKSLISSPNFMQDKPILNLLYYFERVEPTFKITLMAEIVRYFRREDDFIDVREYIKLEELIDCYSKIQPERYYDYVEKIILGQINPSFFKKSLAHNYVDTVSPSYPVSPSRPLDANNLDIFSNLLLRWKTKLFVQLWLQEKSMYFYNTWNHILSYSIILISTGSSATLFSTDNVNIKYAIGALTMVTGILTAVSRQMKPAEKYQEHLITTNKYHQLMRKIENYLTLKPLEPTEDKFKEQIEEEINQLIQNQLTPPLNILRLFEMRYGSIDVMMYGNEIINLMIKDTLASKNLEFIKNKINRNVKTMEDIQQIYKDIESLNHTRTEFSQERAPYTRELQPTNKSHRKSWYQRLFQ
jgi:hypothetical protein